MSGASDIDDLSEQQEAELRGKLLRLREELGELIETSAEGTRPVELDQAAVGRVSRIDAIQVQQMAKANREHHRLRLEQVRQALRLVERGDYGMCRRCEEPIGYQRLKARPETPFCVRCQGASERLGAKP